MSGTQERRYKVVVGQSGPEVVFIFGGDPCPRCGAILDYDECDTGDGWEPYLIHPDPQCGWFPSSYPEIAAKESGR